MSEHTKRILLSGVVHGISGGIVAILIRGVQYSPVGFIIGSIMGMLLKYFFELILKKR